MDRTVIILANRFRLIVQMDRILVMDHGRVVEFDTPLNLLDDPKSKFSLMVSQTGDVDPARLRQLALARAERQRSQSPSGVAMERGHSRDSNTQNTTRSYDSQGSLPRSLKDIFVTPETRSSMTSLNTHGSVSSDPPHEAAEVHETPGLHPIPETSPSEPNPPAPPTVLHPGIPSPSSSGRRASLLKQHLKKQLE
jgi:ABC-type sulfate/molybdate transport systems ATPase subunit